MAWSARAVAALPRLALVVDPVVDGLGVGLRVTFYGHILNIIKNSYIYSSTSWGNNFIIN